jgi:hypothetical protein
MFCTSVLLIGGAGTKAGGGGSTGVVPLPPPPPPHPFSAVARAQLSENAIIAVSKFRRPRCLHVARRPGRRGRLVIGDTVCKLLSQCADGLNVFRKLREIRRQHCAHYPERPWGTTFPHLLRKLLLQPSEYCYVVPTPGRSDPAGKPSSGAVSLGFADDLSLPAASVASARHTILSTGMGSDAANEPGCAKSARRRPVG